NSLRRFFGTERAHPHPPPASLPHSQCTLLSKKTGATLSGGALGADGPRVPFRSIRAATQCALRKSCCRDYTDPAADVATPDRGRERQHLICKPACRLKSPIGCNLSGSAAAQIMARIGQVRCRLSSATARACSSNPAKRAFAANLQM